MRRKTGSPAGKRALPPEMNESVEAGSTCARSSRHASRFASDCACLRRDGQGAVLTEDRNANRAGVEALGVSADDVPVDTPVAAFEDGPEAIDEKVVADVVPAVPLHVVELDRPHDRRRLRRRVPVGAGRVVNHREPDHRCERRCAAPDRLVRVPAAPRNDRRGAGLLERSRGHPRLRAPDEVRAQPCDLAAQAVLDPVGRSDPPGVPEPPGGQARALVRARVGLVLVFRAPRPSSRSSAPPASES